MGFAGWAASALWLLCESTAVYAALPWLLVPGVVLDIPLRMLLWLMLDDSGIGFGVVVALPTPLRWGLILAARCAAVHALSPLLSGTIAEILEPVARASAAPYVLRLRSIQARPCYGMCDVEMDVNARQLLRDVGYEHTALQVTAVTVKLSVHVTPLAPFWRCGFCNLQVTVSGGLMRPDYIDRTAQLNQQLELVLRGRLMVHSWGLVRLCAPFYVPAFPAWLAPPLVDMDGGILDMTTTAATPTANDVGQVVQLVAGPVSICVAEAVGAYSLYRLPFVDAALLKVALGGIACTVSTTAAPSTREAVVWTGDDVLAEVDPMPGPAAGTETPAYAFGVRFRRGKALHITGQVGKLWVRTHFRALQMLLAVFAPMPVHPHPTSAVDTRLRQLHSIVHARGKKSAPTNLITAVKSDDILREHIIEDRSYAQPEVAIASMQRQLAERGSIGMPALHLSFEPIESRLLRTMEHMSRPKDGRVAIQAVAHAL
eukprot:COSAG05_NODE_3308_length_2160_cov_2.842795_1_plen_485_part_10